MVVAVACYPALLPTPGVVGVGPWARCSGCGVQPVSNFWKTKTKKGARRYGCIALCKTCSPTRLKEWAHRTGARRPLSPRRPPSPDGETFFCMGACKQWLPRAAFYGHRFRKDGVFLYCKPCEALRNQEKRALCECGGRKSWGSESCLICRAKDGEGAVSILVSALRQADSATLEQLVTLTGYTDRTILRAIATDRSRFLRREVENDGSWCVLWRLA